MKPTDLTHAIRASLNAKLQRLLERPLIARIGGTLHDDDTPAAFRLAEQASRAFAPESSTRCRPDWTVDPEDGTCSVRIQIDYDDRWRGHEKMVLETVRNTLEGAVTFLSDTQRTLLEQSPREFLALNPRPESVELLSFETDLVGESTRVVELKVAAGPASSVQVRHVAIVPNLVQIERQLDALAKIEAAADDGPVAPLRALLGLGDAPTPVPEPLSVLVTPAPDERLDEHQTECIRKALATPHFAVIQGPPGSGKTTVIAGIIRRALELDQRILVVSPTHVAVDNVIEKLTPRSFTDDRDRLETRSLPLRYAGRPKKLSSSALAYWVGPKSQRRAGTISRRVEACLTRAIPFAAKLYALEDADARGSAPLSAAVSGVEAVLCGTPIGILSPEAVKKAEPGTFDLLIVDEVSKMTLPEFLAIAVKARRWVLVGDPEQLPPFCSGEQSAVVLDDAIDPMMELVCSVASVLERERSNAHREERLVVVASDPPRAAAVLRAHLCAVMPDERSSVGLVGEPAKANILVCSPGELESAGRALCPARILGERGLGLQRPDFASGLRFVEERDRAAVRLIDTAFAVYHAQPWSVRAGQQLRPVICRNTLVKLLPSVDALDAAHGRTGATIATYLRRHTLLEAIAERFAVNVISVYDWLTGIRTADFDTDPLRQLDGVARAALCESVQPFVGTLKKQYRMHSSLSRVPRQLFYFGEALHDGKGEENGCRVNLRQVDGEGEEGESNGRECVAIAQLLEALNEDGAASGRRPGIMVVTPYGAQEQRLQATVRQLQARGVIGNLDVEVCTFDRCQGREAEYVFISLVRRHATAFLDMPKRWNVALTRAKQQVFLVGDIDAYLNEARVARRGGRSSRRTMSLLARIIEAYDHQSAGRR